MRLIDFDGIFDQKIADSIAENEGKYTEKQWSEIIPKLYEKFGDTVISTIGKTPRQYYREMDDETLALTLKEHLRRDVPVSDFLCREMENREGSDAFLELLKSEDEALLGYAITVNGENEKAYPYYLDIILNENIGEDMKDAAADQMKGNPDPVKEQLLSMIESDKQKAYALDLISRIHERDERVFSLLVSEFLNNLDDIPMHAATLACYGDERALPYLLEEISHEDINYVEYLELLYAIEALGGEYKEQRDFTSDPYYQQVHGASLAQEGAEGTEGGEESHPVS